MMTHSHIPTFGRARTIVALSLTAGRGTTSRASGRGSGPVVDRPASLKKNWVLTQDAFDALLVRLNPDLERAAAKYEEVRRALVTFFEYRASRLPEDHADETINRVARRLVEGQEIHSSNLASYFFGVARNVLKEQWDTPAALPLEVVRPLYPASYDPCQVEDESIAREHRLDCLERCIQDLAATDRGLIRAYYTGEATAKVQNRKRLAAQLGIPMNALRIRALRIREKLGACVARAGRAPAGADSRAVASY